MNALRSKLPFPTRSRKNKAAVRRSHAIKESKMEDPAEFELCKICHDPVGQRDPGGRTETWSVLPCGHQFGSHCIKFWLGVSEERTCPLCRSAMVHKCGHPVLPMPLMPTMSTGNRNNKNNKNNKTIDKTTSDNMDTSEDNGQRSATGDDEKASMRPTASFQNIPPPSSFQPSQPPRATRASRALNPAAPVFVPNRSASLGSTVRGSSPATIKTIPSMPVMSRNVLRKAPPGAPSSANAAAFDLSKPCKYCLMMLQLAQKSPSDLLQTDPNFETWRHNLGFVRSFLSANGSDFGHNNALWERWREITAPGHGGWWASQYPATEPPKLQRREYWQEQYS